MKQLWSNKENFYIVIDASKHIAKLIQISLFSRESITFNVEDTVKINKTGSSQN